MKNLILTTLVLLGLIISRDGFAHGWLEAGVARFFEAGKVGPSIAVGLYEPLLLGINYESWNGVGVNVRENTWLTSKHDLSFLVSDNVDLSVGVALRHNDVNYSDIHVNVKIGLWE